MNDRNREMIDMIIDLAHLLKHYAEGRRLNWDGSTKAQAMKAIDEAYVAIAKLRKED